MHFVISFGQVRHALEWLGLQNLDKARYQFLEARHNVHPTYNDGPILVSAWVLMRTIDDTTDQEVIVGDLKDSVISEHHQVLENYSLHVFENGAALKTHNEYSHYGRHWDISVPLTD